MGAISAAGSLSAESGLKAVGQFSGGSDSINCITMARGSCSPCMWLGISSVVSL